MTISSSAAPTYSQAVGLGIFRSLVTIPLILPLERIKMIQQAHEYKGFFYLGKRLFHRGGIANFYRGGRAELLKETTKHAALWPVILFCRKSLQNLNANPQLKEVVTGITAGTAHIMLSMPFERAKIIAREKGKEKISLRNGWFGTFIHSSKVCLQWISFLIIQRHFVDKRLGQKEKLAPLDILDIGARTAISVALLSAPLDRAHTLKQIHKKNMLTILKTETFCSMYRGWHLNALTGFINCAATIATLHWIDQRD